MSWRKVVKWGSRILGVLAAAVAVVLAALAGKRLWAALEGRVVRSQNWRPTSDPSTISVKGPGGGWHEAKLPQGVTSDQVVAAGRGANSADVTVEVLHEKTDRRAVDDPGDDLPI
tara:strand:- start:44 stop:388 length:345 start_codon:yes stop_codon:yes gene_type:complete